jgi:NAD+ diphosphatase
MSESITFSGSTLDRSSNQRRDAEWIARHLDDDAARFLPMWKLNPLVKLGEQRSLAWAKFEMFDDVVPAPTPVLLGIDGDVAHFAVDVSSVEDPEVAFGVDEVAKFEELRGVVPQLSHAEASIAAHARSLTDWHARHGFCAACGSATVPESGGANRRCPDCAVEHFPRTDPVAIAVVGRGDQCLLGRGPGWPNTMYSALAGFIEPGETLEEAVRREVQEESGIRVGPVHYVKSQPWPFPSSLMIGCIGEGESDEITIDFGELEDVKWFSLETIRAALDGHSSELFIPPPFAVAHHLVRAWAEQRGGAG